MALGNIGSSLAGDLGRHLYAARDLADETYRRRIGRQLNKGENLHALKRSLAYTGEGALRRPAPSLRPLALPLYTSPER